MKSLGVYLNERELDALRRVIAGIGVPIFLCRARSFEVLDANPEGFNFFGRDFMGRGASLEDALPSGLVDAIRFNFFDKGALIKKSLISWPRLDGIRELVVDVFGATASGAGGVWVLRLTDVTNPIELYADPPVSSPLAGLLSGAEFPQGSGLISFALQLAREEERAKLGIEIHDSLGQEITVTQLGLALLRNELGELQDRLPNSAEILAQLKALSSQLASLALTSRRLAFGLRPTTLTTKGLEGAARDLVTGFSAKFGVVGTLVVHPEWINPNDAWSFQLYRCLQEMLNNVAKHSRATRFRVTLGVSVEGLFLETMDNGVGFSFSPETDYFRWYSLKARVQDIKGNLCIKTRPEVDGTLFKVYCSNHGSTP